jgi:hypothetical protein
VDEYRDDYKMLVVAKGCGFTQPLVYLRKDEPEAAEIIVAVSQSGNTSQSGIPLPNLGIPTEYSCLREYSDY